MLSQQSINTYMVTMRQYLFDVGEGESASSFTNGSRKLEKLSLQQFEELSKDVYDELDRRLNRPELVPFLPLKSSFHPKRNQARQKLATLYSSKFTDLIIDIYQELRRRFPQISDSVNKTYIPQKTPNSDGFQASKNHQNFNGNNIPQPGKPIDIQYRQNLDSRIKRLNTPDNSQYSNDNQIKGPNNPSTEPRSLKTADFNKPSSESKSLKTADFIKPSGESRSFKQFEFNNPSNLKPFKPIDSNSSSPEIKGMKLPEPYNTPNDHRNQKPDYNNSPMEPRSFRKADFSSEKQKVYSTKDSNHTGVKAQYIDRIKPKDGIDIKDNPQKYEKSALSNQLASTPNGSPNSAIIKKYKAEIEKLKQQISKISSNLKIQIEKNSVFLEGEKNNISIRSKNSTLIKENNQLASKIKSMNIEMDSLNMENISLRKDLDAARSENDELSAHIENLEKKYKDERNQNSVKLDNRSNSDATRNGSDEFLPNISDPLSGLPVDYNKTQGLDFKSENVMVSKKSDIISSTINLESNKNENSSQSRENSPESYKNALYNITTSRSKDLRTSFRKLGDSFWRNSFSAGVLISLYTKAVENSRLLYQKSIESFLKSLSILGSQSEDSLSIQNTRIQLEVGIDKVDLSVMAFAQDVAEFENHYSSEVQAINNSQDSADLNLKLRDVANSCSRILESFPESLVQLEFEMFELKKSVEAFKKNKKPSSINLIQNITSRLTTKIYEISDLANDQSFYLLSRHGPKSVEGREVISETTQNIRFNNENNDFRQNRVSSEAGPDLENVNAHLNSNSRTQFIPLTASNRVPDQSKDNSKTQAVARLNAEISRSNGFQEQNIMEQRRRKESLIQELQNQQLRNELQLGQDEENRKYQKMTRSENQELLKKTRNSYKGSENGSGRELANLKAGRDENANLDAINSAPPRIEIDGIPNGLKGNDLPDVGTEFDFGFIEFSDSAYRNETRYKLLVSSNSIVNNIEYVFHIVKNNSLSNFEPGAATRRKIDPDSEIDYGSISIVLFDNLKSICGLVTSLIDLCKFRIFKNDASLFNLTRLNTELGVGAVKGLEQGYALISDFTNDICDIVEMVDGHRAISSTDLINRFGNSLKNLDLKNPNDVLVCSKLMDPLVSDLIQDPVFKQNIIMSMFDVAKFTKTLISIFE
ncbi:Protein SPA2 [Smittium mucronatum]|uniref:Protein SPA2 n=1 Tax=Smittium mucronatum TaxID=133383 RepID=A0A1R0H3A2_9FUNG|nr:Protein SPA2 [Smittium mucronatum]